MSDWSERAERAIAAFEELSGLRVTVHDYALRWWQLLPYGRFEHHHPACDLAKAHRQPACTAFDARLTLDECRRRPEGFAKVCHIGALELVVPHLHGGRVAWLLFAGPLRPQPGISALADPQEPGRGGPWAPLLQRCEAVDARRAAVLLEGLRQLAARLAALADECEAAGLRTGEQPRAETIRRYILARHAEEVRLADLAGRLGLSADRAGHLVRELCGQGFKALLIDARLHSAAGLLRQTALPIPEIARRAGFANLANFHRQFRRRFACTPRRYRVQPGDDGDEGWQAAKMQTAGG